MQHQKSNDKKRIIVIFAGIVLLAIITVLILFFAGVILKSELTVGNDIVSEDVSEFYYTYSTSTYPPEYQRYYFYTENGKHMFYHEQREGKTWPLTEEHITVSGRMELSDSEWAQFFGYLQGGKVKKREKYSCSGSSGPWMYLYRQNDRSKYQQFYFASYDKQVSFEDFCLKLKEAC